MPTLLVLAAGVGSRFGGLKQMEPVGPGGEAILDYSVFDARRAGFQRAVFIIRRDIEQDFREVLGKRFEAQMDVAYAFQELDALPPPHAVPAGRTKPWGTGHAVLCAGAQVHEPFAVVNADDFYGRDAFRVLGEFLSVPRPPGAHAMVGFQLRNTLSENGTVSRGVCQADARGFLTAIEEMTAIEKTGGGARHRHADGREVRLTGAEPVSMNCWGFQTDLFGHLERGFARFLAARGGEQKSEFYLTSDINQMMADGHATVQVLPTSASWFGITYREDRPAVVAGIRALVAAGEYPDNLRA